MFKSVDPQAAEPKFERRYLFPILTDGAELSAAVDDLHPRHQRQQNPRLFEPISNVTAARRALGAS